MRRRGRFTWSAIQLVVALAVLTAASPAAFGAPAATAAAGDLDGTFGIGGKVTTDFVGAARGIAVQPDGKIVTAGATLGVTLDFALARYNPDGSLDATFGTGGKVTTDFAGSNEQAFAVALQQDGKIVAAGTTGNGTGSDFALARYNPDGSLDATFGTDGKVRADFAGGADQAFAVAIQPDGKIVAAGPEQSPYPNFYDFGLSRYEPDGSPDPTFGTGGKVATDIDPTSGQGSVDLAHAVALQPDGKIVAAGFSENGVVGGGPRFAVVRYQPDGGLDGTFGTGGKVTTDLVGSHEEAEGLVLQPDGKIVVAGGTGTATASFDFALARYGSDGSLDPAFGAGGIVTTDLAGNLDKAHSIARQSDGKLVVAGETLSNGLDPSYNFALARYNEDGSLDTTFGAGGTVTTDFGGHNDHAFAIALQPDGNIVAAGDAFPDFALARYVGGGAAPATADLGVAITDSPDPVPAGQTLTYDVTVANHGPSDATGVTLIDTLAAGAGRIREIHIDLNSVVSSQGSCSTPSDGTLACLLGTIPATGSATITISVTPTEAGTMANMATASANEPDPNLADNSASETTTVNPAADLSVTLSDSPDPVLGGQALTYTATVANHGPSNATGVSLTDALPAGVAFVSATASQGTCSHAAGTVSCDLGLLAAAGSATVTITVIPDAAGTIRNAAAVGANELDPNPADNSASESTTVNAGADLALMLTDSPDPVLVGQTLAYTATVANNGPLPASGVSVTNTLPAGVAFVSAEPGGVGKCSQAAGTVRCDLDSLLAGDAATFAITVTPTEPGPITDTAAAGANEPDPNPADNAATETTTVNAAAGLALTLTDSPDPVLAGQPLTYTATVANDGPSAASGVTLTDTLPSSVDFASATASQGTCHEAAGTASCDLGTVLSGEAATVALTVRPTETGPITDTAAASANEDDLNPADNSATEATTVIPAADLAVTLTDSPDPVIVRGTLTYTATVTNNGPSTASWVRLTDTLPDDIVFVSATASQGPCHDHEVVPVTGSVTCLVGELANGASATVTITVTPTKTGSISDTAAASANEGDPNPADNSATEATAVDPGADLAVTMSDSPDPVPVGQTLVYTATVTNNGPALAHDVTLADALPAGITFLSATARGGCSQATGTCSQVNIPCSQASGALSCELGSLSPMFSAIVTITVTTTSAGTITNRATVTGTEPPDPIQANNTATATTTVTFIDGKIVFASRRDGNFEIYSVNPNGTALTRLTMNTASDESPAWAPGGARIASMSTRDGNAEIYVMNADGTGQTRLTFNGAIDSDPTWSPDGTKLAFESNRDGNFEIYVMNADGTGQTRLTINGAIDIHPAWSPDGTKLAFESNRDGNFEIYVMNADSTGQTRLTINGAIDSDPAWSPSGTKLAFESNRDGPFRIYLMNANGSAQTARTSGRGDDIEPAWSPADGSKIVFASTRNGGNLEIYVMASAPPPPCAKPPCRGDVVTQLTRNAAIDFDPAWQGLE